MPRILSIPVRLLVASLAIIAVPACSGGDRSTGRAAITCPPGTTRAAKQNICVPDPCGNGIVDADEACDDGNVIAGDGCSTDCRSTELCGNGTVDHTVGEVCDDGNTAPGDRCCSDCRSCPELAVLPGDEAAEVRTATVPAPCPPAAPAADIARAIAAQDASVAALAGQARPQAHPIMRPVRPAAASGPASRLGEQAHASTLEELTQAHSTIAALEQSNAELRQSLAEQLRQLEDMQQRLRRGIVLQ